MLARTAEISKRWLVLGLAIHGLAAVLVLTNVLCSSAERRAVRVSTPAAVEPEAHTTRIVGPAAPANRREESGQSELQARATSAAAALAQVLEGAEFEDERWRAEVAARARALGAEAIPALRALLADEQRSVEEHVAATELVAALERP